MEQVTSMKDNNEYNKLVEVCNVEIGVSPTLRWVFKKKELVYEYNKEDEKDTIFWLPLLEVPYNDLLTLLQVECKRIVLNVVAVDQLVSSFPTNSILKTALESNSEYWANLALGWCEEMDDLKEQRERLEAINKNKKYSQKARHRAMKLLRKAR
jgi:hypothetical protein